MSERTNLYDSNVNTHNDVVALLDRVHERLEKLKNSPYENDQDFILSDNNIAEAFHSAIIGLDGKITSYISQLGTSNSFMSRNSSWKDE